MEPSEHLEAIADEGARISTLIAATQADAEVPGCPGWRFRDLVAHLGYVHRWAAGVVAGALAELPPDAEEAEVLGMGPPDDELANWFASGLSLLVSALAEAPEDLACAQFLPAASPRAFWARRQAHETAVHRLDAQLAAGARVTAFAAGFAVDGIDELLFGFLGRRAPQGADPIDAVLGLEATDTGACWSAAMGARGVRAARGIDGAADAVVSASASDLYRLLWNRATEGAVRCKGDETVLGRWRERYRITW